MNNVPLKSFQVTDLSELYIAMDAMHDVVHEWIKENTDDYDRVEEKIMNEINWKKTNIKEC